MIMMANMMALCVATSLQLSHAMVTDLDCMATTRDTAGMDIPSALAAADIGDPARMAGVLRGLGMSALHEACLLDPPEVLEMTTVRALPGR
jgi:hypothetical protein